MRDGQIDTGARVRRLPKILDVEEATRLLDIEGFDAADAYLSEQNPREHELYSLLERARLRLKDMSVKELLQAQESEERLAIFEGLKAQLDEVLTNIEQFEKRATPARKSARSA